jgi:hypothetical protein
MIYAKRERSKVMVWAMSESLGDAYVRNVFPNIILKYVAFEWFGIAALPENGKLILADRAAPRY